MSGDDQRKPKGMYNWGPETAPQLRSMQHGQGGPPVLAYTSNPVSVIVDLFRCVPFLDMKTGNADAPINRAVSDELEGFSYDVGRLDDYGRGHFERGIDLNNYQQPGGPVTDVPAVTPVTRISVWKAKGGL